MKWKLKLTDADDDDGVWKIKILNLNIKQIYFFSKNYFTVPNNTCKKPSVLEWSDKVEITTY